MRSNEKRKANDWDRVLQEVEFGINEVVNEQLLYVLLSLQPILSHFRSLVPKFECVHLIQVHL